MKNLLKIVRKELKKLKKIKKGIKRSNYKESEKLSISSSI